MTVVSDTSVLCYLVLLDCIDILPRRFGPIAIPVEVAEECLQRGAPDRLSAFIRTPPGWLHILPAPTDPIPELAVLDAGESAAIRLALARDADLQWSRDRPSSRGAAAICPPAHGKGPE